MPIVSIDDKSCVNCGMCVKICPMDVLRPDDAVPRIAYRQDCQSCFLCRLYCPTNALKVTADRTRPSALPW